MKYAGLRRFFKIIIKGFNPLLCMTKLLTFFKLNLIITLWGRVLAKLWLNSIFHISLAQRIFKHAQFIFWSNRYLIQQKTFKPYTLYSLWSNHTHFTCYEQTIHTLLAISLWWGLWRASETAKFRLRWPGSQCETVSTIYFIVSYVYLFVRIYLVIYLIVYLYVLAIW